MNVDVEGEYRSSATNDEGKHSNVNLIVEWEQTGFIPSTSNDQTDVFHDITDNVSNAGEGSETDEIFEDAPLDFDPTYPPMNRWIQSHQK